MKLRDSDNEDGPEVDESLIPREDKGATVNEVRPTGGLGAQARSAVLWNTAFNLFRDFTQFITMLVLVRLIAPASYGEFGMTNSIIGFFSVFGFGIFVAHSLQVQEQVETRYQEHFTAGGVLNGALFLVVNACAGVLWWFPKYAVVAPYVHVMSFTFLLEWPCELRRKMLERQLDWKRLRLLHATGIAAGAVVALLMAWAGAGTWALLLPGLLVTVPFIYDLFVTESWRPLWQWSWKAYQAAFRFGVTRLGSGTATAGRTLLETSVLTAVLGYSGLGIYNRAIGLSVIFCSKFASQLVYAIYPVLTRIERHGGDPVRTGDLVLRLIAWSAIPVATMLGALAQPVVRVVYGASWEAVVPLLPWALAVTVLQSLMATGSSLLLARQQAARCLAIDVITLAGTGLALFLVSHLGPVGYLCGIGVLLSLLLCVILKWLTKYRALSIGGIASAIAPPLLIAGAAWMLLELPARFQFESSGGGQVVRAIVWGTLFGAIYILGIRLCFKRALAALISVFPARRTAQRLLFLTTSA